ncbi:Aste57867_24823 [Aphanomyces stellatus]|uniref:Aste57867_24823 protein n=1 Tax=Aphanomyces stellatus TaxID=120398 RepID=A0A485LTJ0_9STRA|nr:hypothetical protein As57867_024745 [Aphanomyces stellatus]VFU01458.1 Aste57867_24823 [Aphanomyces stellatus]
MQKRFPTPKWAGVPTRANSKAFLEVWKDGEQLKEHLSIGQQAFYILGRNTDVCDFELAHQTISRQHAAFVHTKGGAVELIDLGSAQGTTVDGIKLKADPEASRTPLANGSEITFGESTRKYVVRGLNQAPAPTTTTSAAGVGSAADMQSLPTGFSKANAKQSQKEAERQARDEEIRRMTMEMMTQAPKVQHVPNVAVARTADDEPTETPEPAARPASISRVVKGPAKPPSTVAAQEIDSDAPESDSDDDDDDSADDLALRYNLPLKSQVVLASHTKSISCVAVDGPGGRVATGSMDYHMKLWDFAGMARHVRPFRDAEVEEGHPIVALSYSPTGDRLLAVTGSSQPSVLSREGVKELQFVKGDMYVMDMVHTKGHTHSCTGGAWHPVQKQSMATSSLDGTIRLWKLDGTRAFDKLQNDQVIKLKSKQGKRVEATTCSYNHDGSLVFGATTDGLVYGYDLRRQATTPSVKIDRAHAAGSADLGISSIRFANDKIFGTRSCSDDCLKLWDVRKPQAPIKTIANVASHFAMANLAFNAAGTAVAVGTSVQTGQGLHGQVHFYDVLTAIHTPLTTIDMHTDESAVCVAWHPKINQVFVGSSASTVRVFYDEAMSTKGVLLTATKKIPLVSSGYSRIDENDGTIVNPHALPMFRDDNNRPTKRKYAKIRMDPIASKKPQRPISGPGFGGSTGGSTLTQFFMRDQIKAESIRSQDPREAILKYAQVADSESVYLGSAYAASQPKDKIAAEYQLAKQTLEEEKTSKEDEARRLLDL